MPIRINLMSEVLVEEELRRRDPVKRALFIGGFLVALTLTWYSTTWVEYKMQLGSLNRIKAEIQLHTNDYSQVQIEIRKIADGKKRLAALQNLSTNRFLQGNLMNALQQTYLSGVQLMRLKLDQNYILKEGTPDKTNNFGVVRGKPGTSTQQILLSLDAKDSSANPGDQVNYYKDALAKLDYFKNNLSVTNGVKLTSLSPPTIPIGARPFVLFTLECRFTEKTR